MPAQNLLGSSLSFVIDPGPWRLIHWYLAALTLAAGVWVVFGGQHRRLWADHDLAWWLWHWFTGGRLEPRRSFPDIEDERTAKQRAPRRVVVGATRSAGTVAVVAVEYTRSGAPHGTGLGVVVLAGAVGAVGLAAASVAVVHVACRVAHYRQWVLPLHRAVYQYAGWPETKRPRSYLKIGRNLSDFEGSIWRKVAARFPLLHRFGIGLGGVVVKVAPDFKHAENAKGEAPAQQNLVSQVCKKLALTDVTPHWSESGRHNNVQIRPKAQMPATAFYRDPDIRALVGEAKESAPILGVTYGNQPVTVDLDSESPHILLSMGTGAGKSSLTRTIAAQMMAKGADVTIIDVKRHSHRWARGVEGVRYVRDLGEINRVLCELGQESHRRNVAWDDVGIDDEGPRFRRHIVLFEETNATMGALKDWWKNHKESGDPPTCPGIRYYGQVLFTGRAVQMNVISISQMATARDVGGPEIRENFNTRCVGRHTKRNWEMLIPQIPYQPAENHPGRIFVCIGTEATRTQVIFMTEHEARALATSGRDQRVLDVASRETPVSLGKHPATVAETPSLATLRDAIVTSTPEPELVTLQAAAPKFGMTYHALRKSVERATKKHDSYAPQLKGKDGPAGLYVLDDIDRYLRNRERGTALAAPPTEGRNEVDEVDRIEAGTRA